MAEVVTLAEAVKLMDEDYAKEVKLVGQELVKTAVKAHALATRYAPTSAKVRKAAGASRGGGGRLAGSIAWGVYWSGRTATGWVGTDVDYARFTEVRGANGRINVGTPRSPTLSWPAKQKRMAAGMGRMEQRMPYLASAFEDVREDHEKRMIAIGRRV